MVTKPGPKGPGWMNGWPVGPQDIVRSSIPFGDLIIGFMRDLSIAPHLGYCGPWTNGSFHSLSFLRAS